MDSKECSRLQLCLLTCSYLACSPPNSLNRHVDIIFLLIIATDASSMKVTPVVVAEILALSNLQRAPGNSGVFSRFTQHLHGVPEQVYIDAHGGLTPFPTSLIVSYI
ncbi:hypothetical protein C8R42DRAFT_406820 [Lentinula raphanica]|nr:hypothetical protein C8R42DRAFT_406820 [Lentinula raphanica]